MEGAGEEWQGVVRALAGASKAVVMCPNHGEGVQWELDLISQAGGRLQTIFLASPELDRTQTLSLFQRLVPGMTAIDEKQLPIAAYEQGECLGLVFHGITLGARKKIAKAVLELISRL